MQTEREMGSLIHRSAVEICTLLKQPFLSCLLIAYEPFHSIALVPSFRIHGCPAFTKNKTELSTIVLILKAKRSPGIKTQIQSERIKS